jgi:glycosyltransferase involved in cell wall biosynthesis
VLWIAALASHKSPLEVIEIAKALPAMDFVMIGSPWDASLLEQLMKERASNVHYLGPVSDRKKKELIRRSSVGITTSKYEGFGWTPFEFLTAGKPVLAYPLNVFREIYGDALIYANDINAFIRKLTELRRKGFESRVDSSELGRLRRRWNLDRAVSRIVKVLHIESVVILTRDWPSNSNMILGCDLINWKLWKRISDLGVPLQIFANGTRYARRFHLSSRTTTVSQRLTSLKRIRNTMNKTSQKTWDSELSAIKGKHKVTAMLLDLTLRVFEPFCYLLTYVKKRERPPSNNIIASEVSTAVAGLIIKLIFGSRLFCLVHDTDFYDRGLREASIPTRVYYMIFVNCLRHADRIIAVSSETKTNLSRFCPDTSKIIVLWEPE